MHHSFRNTFAPPLAAIAFILALLMAKWAGAAEQPRYRLPGGCVVTTELVTHKDGTQQLVRHTRCEYTESQRARMAREGK